MTGRVAKGLGEGFTLRVRAGEYEVELSGPREEVLETVKELPKLVTSFGKAFEKLKSKTVLTVTTAVKGEAKLERYPKIPKVENDKEALIKILESDWGRWRPRTLGELKEALEANKISYSDRKLAKELLNLVRKGKVRRWKTDNGYVYILAEEELITQREEKP
ncbi:hypothetical protein H5T51_03875 [Candidatus Bathyarchaeota archaeon]|nr:hypothetical protein [Candidatus Bathyarchaeota archaeon]